MNICKLYVNLHWLKDLNPNKQMEVAILFALSFLNILLARELVKNHAGYSFWLIKLTFCITKKKKDS